MNNLQQFALHTITTRPWPIETAIDRYAAKGFGGISIWRDSIAGKSLSRIKAQIKLADIKPVSLVRGGFFAHRDKNQRKAAIEENIRCIDEAYELGIPLIVLVCGSDPSGSLEESRQIIEESLATLVPFASEAQVKLGIEPLHPMYADTRSAVNTLNQATRIALSVNQQTSSMKEKPVCTVVDVYHLWWDEQLSEAIEDAGKAGVLGAFHISDWKIPTKDILWDRGLMGEGCIDIPLLSQYMSHAGFKGFSEVEIFSHEYWNMDQDVWLENIANACRNLAESPAFVPGMKCTI